MQSSPVTNAAATSADGVETSHLPRRQPGMRGSAAPVTGPRRCKKRYMIIEMTTNVALSEDEARSALQGALSNIDISVRPVWPNWSRTCDVYVDKLSVKRLSKVRPYL